MCSSPSAGRASGNITKQGMITYSLFRGKVLTPLKLLAPNLVQSVTDSQILKLPNPGIPVKNNFAGILGFRKIWVEEDQ